MKTSLLKSLIIAGLAWLSVGCSTQYREASPQLSSEDISALFEEIAQGGGFVGASVGELDELQINSIYHVMSNTNRPAVSVFSYNDLGFFDPSMEGMSIIDLAQEEGIEKVDVLFVDGFDADNNRRFALMVRLELYEGAPLYFTSISIPGSVKFTDDSFQAEIEGANGEIISIYTNDVHPDYADELDNAAHLEFWQDFGYGQEFIGQVSTMAGYE